MSIVTVQTQIYIIMALLGIVVIVVALSTSGVLGTSGPKGDKGDDGDQGMQGGVSDLTGLATNTNLSIVAMDAEEKLLEAKREIASDLLGVSTDITSLATQTTQSDVDIQTELSVVSSALRRIHISGVDSSQIPKLALLREDFSIVMQPVPSLLTGTTDLVIAQNSTVRMLRRNDISRIVFQEYDVSSTSYGDVLFRFDSDASLDPTEDQVKAFYILQGDLNPFPNNDMPRPVAFASTGYNDPNYMFLQLHLVLNGSRREFPFEETIRS